MKVGLSSRASESYSTVFVTSSTLLLSASPVVSYVLDAYISPMYTLVVRTDLMSLRACEWTASKSATALNVSGTIS